MTSLAPAFLPDHIIREILLRVPPQPSCLPRASLVCKLWRDIITEPDFRHRYRARHRRRAPVLGIFCNNRRFFIPSGDTPDCIPASRLSLPVGWTVLGCYQQGRAILHDGRCGLLIWDPIFREEHHVAIPPMYNHFRDLAAVLLGDDEDEDNDDGFRFRIVVAFIRQNFAEHGRTSDGMLGFVWVMESRLHLWSMETDGRGCNSWMLRRTVHLINPLLARPLYQPEHGEAGPPFARMIGANEEGTVVCLRRAGGIVLLRLESTPLIKKIYQTSDKDRDQKIKAVYPYANVFL